jgi:hypothetical protein
MLMNLFKENSNHIAWNHGFSSMQCLEIFQEDPDKSRFTRDMIYFGIFMDVMKQEVIILFFCRLIEQESFKQVLLDTYSKEQWNELVSRVEGINCTVGSFLVSIVLIVSNYFLQLHQWRSKDYHYELTDLSKNNMVIYCSYVS